MGSKLVPLTHFHVYVLFLQGWLLYTSKSVACSLHSVPIQNMYKQPKDFVGIISFLYHLSHISTVHSRWLVCVYIVGYRWLLIVFYLYCRVCSSSQTNCIPVVHPPNQVHRLSAHMVGVELEIYWCQLFIMVTIGIAIVNLRCVVACWIIVSANDGGIIMTVAM